MTLASRPGEKSGGQITSRAARPSSSISARAATNCDWAPINTDFPANSRRRLAKIVEAPISRPRKAALGASMRKPGRPATSTLRLGVSARAVFIESNEFSKGLRKIDFLGCGEGVGPEFVLEPGDEDRETQRIEPRFGEDQIISQRSDLLFLFGGDIFDLGKYR
jgi:hypothetical protein